MVGGWGKPNGLPFNREIVSPRSLARTHARKINARDCLTVGLDLRKNVRVRPRPSVASLCSLFFYLLPPVFFVLFCLRMCVLLVLVLSLSFFFVLFCSRLCLCFVRFVLFLSVLFCSFAFWLFTFKENWPFKRSCVVVRSDTGSLHVF